MKPPDLIGLTLTYEGNGTRRPLVTKSEYGKARNNEVLTTQQQHSEAGVAKAKTVAAGAEAALTEYDTGPRGEVRGVVQPGGATWGYDYDKLQRLTKVTPPSGSAMPTQTFTFDGLGRPRRRTLGLALWLTTWAAGAATTTTPKGNQEVTQYDGRGRPVSVVVIT